MTQPWRRIACFCLGLCGAVPAVVGAEDEPDAAALPPRLTPLVEVALGRFQEYVDAKDWSGAALMLSRILARAPKESFDAAMTNAVLSQVYLQRGEEGDAASAIEPLESALASGFFLPQQELDWMYLLAQLHVQEGNTRRAEELMTRWMDQNVDPSPEGVIFFATLLVDRAQKAGEKADPRVMEEAMFHIERGMMRIPEPPEVYYYLQAACLQGLERFRETAEVLEMMVAQNPERADYWEHLYSMYAADQRDLRALLTIERAQKRGFMLSPTNQNNRVSHYYNLGRYEKVIALLETILQQNEVANPEAMWALLGFACQQTDRIARAIEVYREATQRFAEPKYGIMAANLLYSEERRKEALAALDTAFDVGTVENVVSPSLFAAYVAYELEEFERARAYLERAEPALESDQDRRDFESLKSAVDYYLPRTARKP